MLKIGCLTVFIWIFSESAKDLIKYLRRDDETNSIRRQLGDTNIVQTDLIPIIVYFSDNEELFDVILRLVCKYI